MRSFAQTRGLPQVDYDSWEKGIADGRRNSVWWPGAGTEPLSYSAGYTEGQAEQESGMAVMQDGPRLSGRAACGGAMVLSRNHH